MTTSSTNYTGLYSGGVTTPIPNTAYGNANVVSLLAAGSDGGNTVGNVIAAGNVTASYFIGNGSLLTNINAANVVGAYGNSNVAAFLPTYTGNLNPGNVSSTGVINTTGTMSATGNITTAGFFVGNLVGNITGNLAVPGLTTEVIYNDSGAAGASANFTFNQATNALAVNGTISGTGNITGGNIITTGNVNATTGFSTPGNVYANNISTSPSGGNIYASANICAIGNINTPQAVNAVTVSATGNVQADNVNVTNTVQGGVVLAVGPGGYVSAVGNVVAGSYFIGDGSLISNITAANVNGNVTQATNALTVRFSVKNNTGTTIAKGVPVYATGTVGATTTIEVAPSRADTASTMAAIGLLESALTAGSTGYAVSIGELTSIDTSTYAVGTELYVAATGGLTASRPTGSNVIQTVGTVGRVNASTGSMLVNIWDKNPLPNLGSGNVWVGNAAGYPTETTYGTFDSVYANLFAPGTGSNVFLANSLASGTGTHYANIYADVVSVGNISNAGQVAAIHPIGTGGLIINNATYGQSVGSSINLQNTGAIEVNAISTSSNSGGVTFNSAVAIGNGIQVANLNVYGNVSASYFSGNGSLLTGISVSPAGSNTEVQYNNAGVLGASPFLTYNNSTGNVTVGNQATNGNIIINTVAANAAVAQQPNRIIFGNGYNGNYSAAVDPFSMFRGGVMHVINKTNIANTDTNQVNRAFTSINFVDMQAGTLSSATRRIQGGTLVSFVGNGTFTATNNQWASMSGGGGAIVIGNVGNITMGNATVSHALGAVQSALVGTGGTVGNLIGVSSQLNILSATGTVTNALGQTVNFSGTPTTPPTTVIGYYMPNATATYGGASSNSFRGATNYYFLKNDDDAAQVQLGSMRSYTEYNATVSNTSGSLTIDKTGGQVQQINLTGNITSLGFTNFVSSASDGTNTDEQCDTVTLIFNQGSTGNYGVTFPTGSTYRYAGNITALQSVAANSVSLVSVSAIRISSTTTYLITISPGFV